MSEVLYLYISSFRRKNSRWHVETSIQSRKRVENVFIEVHAFSYMKCYKIRRFIYDIPICRASPVTRKIHVSGLLAHTKIEMLTQIISGSRHASELLCIRRKEEAISLKLEEDEDKGRKRMRKCFETYEKKIHFNKPSCRR